MIGRKNEQQILTKTLQNKEGEFIALVGRRRVGKTYLIEEFYKKHISFHVSGQKDLSNKQHLQIFEKKILENFPAVKLPHACNNWLNVMLNLIHCLKTIAKKNKKKQVIFFDELPWLCKAKSNFLAALGYFWNEWARKNNVVLVVCGSASSWMLSNIVKEKGSLYNRITRLIRLQPFTLSETKLYFLSKNINFNSQQLIQLHMVMGGIPHYLKEVEGGFSATQNIQKICFSQNGLLVHEYGNLYEALFTNSTHHKKIVEALFKSKKGLTKLEIARATKLTPNGAFYDKIEELMECGFIVEVADFSNKSKQNLFRLIDEYSLFYHQFIKGIKSFTKDYWHSVSNTSSYHSWSGYAFENLCFRHIDMITKALQISGMATRMAGFYAKASNNMNGAQIDMVIDRADNCVNIIECKYYRDNFYLTKSEVTKIKNRIASFKYHSQTKKQIFVTIISSSKLLHNKETIGLIENVIEAEQLFN